MIEVTQADRDCRNAIYKELTGFATSGLEASQGDWMDKYIAAHRIAAENASDLALANAYQCGYDSGAERAARVVLDRMRDPTHEIVQRLNASCDTPDVNMAWVFPFIATALADALEAKP